MTKPYASYVKKGGRMYRRPQLPYGFMTQWPYKDRLAWSDALVNNGIFKDSSRATSWKKDTLHQVARSYNQWIEFYTAYFDGNDSEPGERVTGEKVAAYVRYLQRKGLQPSTVLNFVSHLKMALSAIARDSDWDWMSESLSYLRKRCAGSDRKQRIHSIDSIALWDMGTKLMELARPRTDDSLKRALLFRDGLMITLLASRPIRLSNLAMIRIGKHLQLVGSVWHLVFQAGETKQGRPYEVPLPREFTDFLERYLPIHRPRIGNADNHDFLWASVKSGGLGKEACADVVRKRTADEFGFAVSPHLSRDLAVTTIARNAPGKIGIASKILGHASPEVTEKHYNRARSFEAASQYMQFVDELKTGPLKRPE
jgi:integrase/recombinase XerD